MTSMADMEPRSPSKLPPLGTESMCEPKRMGLSELSLPGRMAVILPAVSMRGSRPAARIKPMAYLRPATSASEYATRLTPSAKAPPGERPYTLRPSRLCCRRAALMLGAVTSTANDMSGREAAAKPRSSSRRVSTRGIIYEENPHIWPLQLGNRPALGFSAAKYGAPGRSFFEGSNVGHPAVVNGQESARSSERRHFLGVESA